MIIIKIKAGLGNQMFQYACGRALSLRNNDVLELDLAQWADRQVTDRPYGLNNFKIVENIAKDSDIKSLKYPLGIMMGKLLNKMKTLMRIDNIKFIPSIIRKKGNIYLDGYWQSEKYFADFAEQIRKDFQPRGQLSHASKEILKNIDTRREFKLNHFNLETATRFSNFAHPLKDHLNRFLVKLGIKEKGYWQNEKYFKSIENNIKKEFTLINPLRSAAKKFAIEIGSLINSISIHIRRGDYVSDQKTNKYHGTCGPEYYSKAIKYITSKIGSNIHVFVFSDDIEWVKQNMPLKYPVTYVSSPEIPDYEELILMSQCKHNIIANSTFSWWGAWLNENPDKIVIAPKRWTLKGEKNFKDICPPSWTRI
ncbi:MAG: alpha-1,2-fucosyltransferase [Candidatus Taylorbacteria bacterium]